MHTAWDLGKGANMAIWLFQVALDEVQVIGYIEGAHDETIPDLVAKLKQYDYAWGVDYVPHDAKVRELGTGKTRVEALAALYPELHPVFADAAGLSFDHKQQALFMLAGMPPRNVSNFHWGHEVYREIRPYVRLLVGQHGAPLPAVWDPDVYDLMLSCVDNFVEHFRSLGLRSERLRFAFEPSLLERLSGTAPTISISFVGNVSMSHASRMRWLEHVCGHASVQVWMPRTPGLPDTSAITRHHHEAVWGLQMYEVLHRSSMTLNHHIDVAEAYAGNLRLFEATGVGTLLVTDWKKNLHEMFEPGKEVVTYRTPEECVELVRYYLDHEDERRAVAAATTRVPRAPRAF